MCDFGKHGLVLYDALSGRHVRFEYGRTADVDIYICMQNTVGKLMRHARSYGQTMSAVVMQDFVVVVFEQREGWGCLHW